MDFLPNDMLTRQVVDLAKRGSLMETTRREVLRWTLLSAAGAGKIRFLAQPEGSRSNRPRSPEIKIWATYGDRRHASQTPAAWEHASHSGTAQPNAHGAAAIVLKPEQKLQEILGFGAAFTDTACYMFNQLPAESRAELFQDLFHPAQMALNVCRICMGSSDYSTKVYSYDDEGPDPELAGFSIAHDRDYILPMLKEARRINPEIFLFASPWSPPGWMKAGGSMLGGSMRRKYLPLYAQYFLKFLQAYAAEGVPVQAVTPQNEVDTDQDGRMPACLWPQEYEIEFVARCLGPLLREKAMATQIWILDHNYNLWGRVMGELENTELRQFCQGIAWHGYVGQAEMMTRVHEAYPAVGMRWTEGGPDYTSPDYGTDWTRWTQVFIDVLRNWCQSITGWNLALDEQGRPNIGPFQCGGFVTIHSQSKAITRSGQYWATSHFSRHIRRGARRFESQDSLPELRHVALENPDGGKVLVVANSGPARAVPLQMGDMRADVRLAHDSVTTLAWA